MCFVLSTSLTMVDGKLWLNIGMMFRGLYEHWSRSQPNSDVANLIQAFFLIQVTLCPYTHALFLAANFPHSYSTTPSSPLHKLQGSRGTARHGVDLHSK